MTRLKPNTIWVCKVLTELSLESDERYIGWWEDQEVMLEHLQYFGDECRWSYAVCEELVQGYHPSVKTIVWLKYDGDEWVKFTPEETSFTQCINHTLG